jgi:hypothetical protein
MDAFSRGRVLVSASINLYEILVALAGALSSCPESRSQRPYQTDVVWPRSPTHRRLPDCP